MGGLGNQMFQYAFGKRNVDIAGFFLFPPTWNSLWFSLNLGTSTLPAIFSWYFEDYRHFLSNFFEDKNRSGRYHLDGTVYAHAALECLRNMINPNAE